MSCVALSLMWSAFLLQLLLQTCVLGDGTYECGNHGRFEYCIDEIPGCVIGCHCHPGYYFDTDTKICEPNSRLIELHRRFNVVQPTQVQKIDVTPNVLYDTEPASTTNTVDGSVDQIAKDANDLGDWLYNQFFKTIENQVINNTNGKNILTRRSGSQPTIEKPKRSKKWRKDRKSSKPKGKKDQLRRKLLRITENDSLFDISSKSSSDSSDSSSSGELSSMEYEVNESNRHKHADDEHGHKKIVMINKKPKEPLPSFIFLPNLDTPFYPPIGLAPPPIAPMYPMVPVPPIPLCPETGCIDIVYRTSTAITTATATEATTTSIPTVPTLTSSSSSAPQIVNLDTETTDVKTTTDVPKIDTRALRIKNRKKKKAAKSFNNDRRDTEQGSSRGKKKNNVSISPTCSRYYEDKRINSVQKLERQKILQRLKEKLGNPSAKLFMPSWKKINKIYSNKFTNQNGDAESPFLDNRMVDNELLLHNERDQKPMLEDENFPDNVDFKYITELIHRVDPNNKSNNLPPIEYNPLDSSEMYSLPKIHNNPPSDYSVPIDIPDGRRRNRPMHNKADESYYANLGRQIATMIRGTDTEEKVKLAETPNKKNNDAYFNNNSPTSFWERSVRSPLAYLKAKNKNFEYLKRSNELLFDIENKVEIIASTAPSLTLQEIENIVNVMEAAKKEIQSKNIPSMTKLVPSHRHLNIDLLPHNPRDFRKDNIKKSVLSNLNKINQEKYENNYQNNMMKPDNVPDVHMHNYRKFEAWNDPNINRNIKPINQTRYIPTTATTSLKNMYYKITPTNYKIEKSSRVHQISAITSPFSQNTIKQSFLNQYPYFLHHRKYFQDNNNYYVNRNVELPHFPPIVKIAGVQPSYFPEINHFDYMD